MSAAGVLFLVYLNRCRCQRQEFSSTRSLIAVAGFFGLFDYSKEGPGIDKMPRKKKALLSFLKFSFANSGSLSASISYMF